MRSPQLVEGERPGLRISGRLTDNRSEGNMDPTEFLRGVSALLTPLVEGTDPAQLAGDTPCEDFTVGDLLGHVTLGRFMFGAGLAGDSERQQELVTTMPARLSDVLGDDHCATYRRASADLDCAVEGVADATEMVSLAFGEMAAGDALRMLAADNYVHCWDLACATGQDFAPASHLTDEAVAFFRSVITDDFRGRGAFGPEIEVSADASSFEHLLGFCGRAP